MAEQLKNSLLELSSQSRSQKDTIEKYKSHLIDILKLNDPQLTELLQVFISTGNFFQHSV